MAFDWMNSGPSPLDLTTPLQQGEQIGQEGAYRRAQIADQAATQQRMKEALGLQEKQESFQESVYNAGGAMRAAQLQMATANAQTATTNANQTAAGQPILNDFTSKVAAMSDPDEINNVSIPSGLSPEQTQQAQEVINQKRGTQSAILAADAAGKLHLNNVAQINKAVNYGIDPTLPQFKNPDGTPNQVALGAAITAKDAAIADAAEKRLESRDTNKQVQIGVRQNSYETLKSQLTPIIPKMAPIDQDSFRAAETKVNGAMRAKSMLLPGQDSTSLDQAIAEGQMDMETLGRKYNGALFSGQPAGAPAPAQQPTKIIRNPATNQRMGLINGQWVPLQ